MIRLTLLLALAIFAVLVLVPDDETTSDAPDLSEDRRAPAPTITESDAIAEQADGTLVLTTEGGENLVIARVIEPSDLTADDAAQNLPPAEASGALEPLVDAPATAQADTTSPTAGGDAGTAEAAAPPPSDPNAVRLQVTGDRVNFRAGPSTEDEILAALTLGTEVELIERVADGWAHLRVPATGLTGYMSGDFLGPAN